MPNRTKSSQGNINDLNREVGEIHTKIDMTSQNVALILQKMDDIDARTANNTNKIDNIYAWATGVGVTMGAITAGVATYGAKVLHNIGKYMG